MAAPDRDTLAAQLRRHLVIQGPTAAGELRLVLGTSQPTFSRVVESLRADLLVVGRARATWYAARRGIAGVPTEVPLYEVSEAGSREVGRLVPVHPRGFYFDSLGPLAGLYPDLPWFLHDLRPNGFLGRLAPRQHPELGLPADILRWTTDQVVAWLHVCGADLIGSFVLGEPAFQRWLAAAPANPVAPEARSNRYAELAESVMAVGVPGSSAGGEQPKFLATRDGTPVLVKFSPPVRDAVSRRVADLLVCEQLALETVARAGVARAARSSLVEGGGRVFLEVERFDRVGAIGRRGLVSLLALDAQFVGSAGDRWSAAVEALVREGHLSAAVSEPVTWLERFGEWIGNSDMHFGNLSFELVEGRVGGLAPVYDMLPMRYAPRSGELPPVTLPLPSLTPADGHLWASAWQAAIEFWGAVAAHPWISSEFAATARANRAAIEAQAPLLARLPTGPPRTRPRSSSR